MAHVTALTAVVVGWFASVLLLSEAIGHTTYALSTAAALAIWSLVTVVTAEAVVKRDRLDRLAPLALAASAALFTVLAFDAVA
jgi:glutamate/tyrosine decarboxylase-like PLP-dependent enzyme